MSLDNFKYNLQRLKKCDQYWDEMKPNKNGRHCSKCNKTIVDFSDMSFTEIALFMSASDKPVCGFYLPEQLKEINRPYPKFPIAIGLSTFIATAALAEPPSSLQNTVQTIPSKRSINSCSFIEKPIINDIQIDTFFLFGRVEYFDTITNSNQPISFASILVKGKSYGVTTDKEGNFILRYPTSDTAMAIRITSVGFMTYELTDIALTDKKEIDLGTIKMEKWKGEIIEFRVSTKRGSAFGRFWRKITKPFRR